MVAAQTRIVERRLTPVIRSRLADEPVIVLNGPRTVGKSTLLHDLARALGRPVADLDDLPTRRALRADPALFAQGPPPVIVDEFQHVPELLDAIKAELNADLRPGRYVLAGSTRYTTLPRAAQVLTGRVHVIDVWPLAQAEVERSSGSFLATTFADPDQLSRRRASSTTRDEYIRRIVVGGFPLALARSTPTARARWFADYVRLVVERDVLELSRIRQRMMMPRLLRQLAGQTAGVLNIGAASDAVGLDRSTGEAYTKLLEAVFLVHLLPAWGVTLGSRVAAAPKIHVVDSGVAAWLLRLTAPKLAAREPAALTELGHLVETFAVSELLKQASWSDEVATAGHFRTHDGSEVDLVLEAHDGSVVGVEIKATSRIQGADERGLRALSRRLGPLFRAGVVLYTGAHSYAVGDGIFAVSLDQLWSP